MRRLFATFVGLFFVAAIHAQDKTGDTPRKLLYDYLIAASKEHFDARRQVIASLKTSDDIQRRQDELKKKFLESIGPMPEKTPLNGKVVGTLKGDGFRVEKVIYESRPNHHITANLYLPEGAKGPVPGVLVPCGHSNNGKAYDSYQRISILLAKNGIAALCFDPIGQGERRQILTDDGKPGIKSMTDEHTQVGVGAWLVGQSTASYRIWDGMRSIDYLVSRPEIDAKKVGCCGNSGGGTMTSYLMALDDRIYCAAPCCYITSLEKLFATIGPQDAEQNIVGQVAFGMEHADYLTIRAPRPTLLAVATQDFFNIDGSWTTFREASAIYSKLFYPERIALAEYDNKHGYSKPHREATVRWMRRWLLGIDDAIVESTATVFSDADLQCTRSGQVLTDFKGISAFQLNVKYADGAKAKRDAFLALPKVEQSAALSVIGHGKPLAFVKDNPTGGASTQLVTKVGVSLPLTSRLDESKTKVANRQVLVLPERAGDQPGLTERAIADRAVRATHQVLLRGLGGSAKGGAVYSHDFTNSLLSLHLNRPLLGQRVDDVRGIIDWLSQSKPESLVVAAEGVNGPVALHAAALDGRVSEIVIERGIVSWDNIVRTPLSGRALEHVVPGALQKYDLPQLAALIAPRPLTLRGIVDANGKAMPLTDVEAAYSVCRQQYEKLGAGKNFRIETGK
jgi:dienelactone hydrolase